MMDVELQVQNLNQNLSGANMSTRSLFDFFSHDRNVSFLGSTDVPKSGKPMWPAPRCLRHRQGTARRWLRFYSELQG